jgi:hypothetical protein
MCGGFDTSFLLGDELERMDDPVGAPVELGCNVGGDQAIGYHQLQDVVKLQPMITGAIRPQASRPIVAAVPWVAATSWKKQPSADRPAIPEPEMPRANRRRMTINPSSSTLIADLGHRPAVAAGHLITICSGSYPARW